MTMRSLVYLGLLLLGSSRLGAVTKSEEKDLSFADLKHFQIALEKGLYGFLRRGNEVITLADRADFYIVSQYKPEVKEADLAFGSLHNPLDLSERVGLAPGEKGRYLRGVQVLGDYLLLLDSKLRQFLVWNEKIKVWHQPSDLIFDLVRPPADPKGEPPAAEIARKRQVIQKAYSGRRTDPELIAGLAPIPSFWNDREGSQFLLLLRLPAAPLLTLRCEGRHFSRCIAQRACFVQGMNDEAWQQAAGLGVHKRSHEIWIGQIKSRQIRRFKARSCMDIKPVGALNLPKDLDALSGLGFDDENNLWLTHGKPDTMHDASLFRWDAGHIEKLLY